MPVPALPATAKPYAGLRLIVMESHKLYDDGFYHDNYRDITAARCSNASIRVSNGGCEDHK